MTTPNTPGAGDKPRIGRKQHWRCVCKHTLLWHPRWANLSCVAGQVTRCGCQMFDAIPPYRSCKNAIVDERFQP